MSEFIGSRISLVSRSDIRYVGTLHEINSENSTVALENVNVYEYIVFRGSDVKDLRIEEAPAPKESKPPQVPNDPAILGSGTRPAPSAQAPPTPQNQNPRGAPPQGQNGSQQQGPPPGMAPFGQYPPPGFYPPPPAGWGRGGPPGPGFPGMSPFGGPPGWYPPPGHGFPQHPGQFPPPPGYGFPPPGQQFPQQNQQKPAPIGPEKPAQAQAPGVGGTAASAPKQATPPPSKTSLTEVDANTSRPLQPATAPAVRATPAGPKSGRIQPAIPLAISKQSEAATSLQNATQAATAAVAAAMAKLPPAGGQQTNGNAVDNLTRKVNELRTTEPVRAPRQPGPNGFAARGRGRGGRAPGPAKVDVPATDFDFESANAKFNKGDLVKEAIAGSPLGEQPTNSSNASEVENKQNPPRAYNKATSFFDNISSEAKDRTEAAGSRPGGREWRGEEQKKNVETFGQGSVDNGYRGGYRGRGRGRGAYRGRGGYASNGQSTRGRGGGYRGRGDAQAFSFAVSKALWRISGLQIKTAGGTGISLNPQSFSLHSVACITTMVS
ncbi:hypothetical protein EYC84_001750 [Monilinia fructicola]|uniref:DFDF domain-containing protein n=1 Tax=Monilinia fructicola TaxID=38448 RepID=A0A5M9JR88_MONFR|nr:hypothetical protein EYC84_001750 [Monilinia fructicola]